MLLSPIGDIVTAFDRNAFQHKHNKIQSKTFVIISRYIVSSLQNTNWKCLMLEFKISLFLITSLHAGEPLLSKITIIQYLFLQQQSVPHDNLTYMPLERSRLS